MRWLAVHLVPVVLVACGGGRKIVEHEESGGDVAWASDYTAGVQEACECTDAACIRAKRPALDALVATHGGLDDAPASVHQGLAKLDICWKQTAHDLALELGDLAKTICECTDSSCAETYGNELAALTTKYGAADENALREVPEATDASRAVFDRIAKCVADKTISAADYLAKTDALASELCGCQSDDCAKTAIKKRFTVFADYLFIGSDPDIDPKIRVAEQKGCKCMADALRRGVQFEASSVKVNLSLQMSCD